MTTQRERIIDELKGSGDELTSLQLATSLGIPLQSTSAVLSDLVNHKPEYGIYAFERDGTRVYSYHESRPEGALSLNGRKKPARKKPKSKPAVADVTPPSPVQTFATPYGKLEVFEKDAVLKMTHADALLLLGTSRG